MKSVWNTSISSCLCEYEHVCMFGCIPVCVYAQWSLHACACAVLVVPAQHSVTNASITHTQSHTFVTDASITRDRSIAAREVRGAMAKDNG
jgi:hypothetical protein